MTEGDVPAALMAAAAALDSEPRDGQLAMAQAVSAALASGRKAPEHLLVQAGTGTGEALA